MYWRFSDRFVGGDLGLLFVGSSGLVRLNIFSRVTDVEAIAPVK